MNLILEQEADGKKLTNDRPSQVSIIALVRSLDWSIFTFLTLKVDSQNLIEISGNLGDDGLAIVIEKNGTQEISERSPESITEVENILIDYLNDNHDKISEYFDSQTVLSQNYYNWKAAQESKLKHGVFIKLISIVVTLMIITTVVYGLYLWTSHEFKFIGHATSMSVATVVETKYRPYMKSMVQIAKYEFIIDELVYFGYFKAATAATRKHYIGDRVKIKYATDDPFISKRLATYKSKYKANYPSMVQ
ncbi:MAG: hypothetical protein OCD76_02025 [Reichenbachiella sp.]